MKLSITTFKSFVYGTIIFIAVGVSGISLSQATPKNKSFEGTWKFKKCHPNGSETSCYEFTLYLLQTGNDICGAHNSMEYNGPADDVYANIGRNDEARPGSVVGTATNNTATLVIHSGRTGEYYMARAEIDHQSIQWSLIGRFTGTDKDMSDMEMFPLKSILIKTTEKFNYISPDNKPIDLKKNCNWPTFKPTFNKLSWNQN